MAMPELLFVDDDPTEIDQLRPLVQADFTFRGIPWPFGRRVNDVVGNAPDIFVLDLYLPPAGRAAAGDITDDEMTVQKALAEQVARGFSALYVNYKPGGGKTLLQQTMACLTNGRNLLDRQWSALAQSPDNGIALLKELRERYPDVPVVFYSRKITPANVVEALRAGAFDTIQKGSLSAEELRLRLRQAIELFGSEQARDSRWRGNNFNITVSQA